MRDRELEVELEMIVGVLEKHAQNISHANQTVQSLANTLDHLAEALVQLEQKIEILMSPTKSGNSNLN